MTISGTASPAKGRRRLFIAALAALLLLAALTTPIAYVTTSPKIFIETILEDGGGIVTMERLEGVMRLARVEIPAEESSIYNVLQVVRQLFANDYFLAAAIVGIGCVALPILKTFMLFPIADRIVQLRVLARVPARLAMLDVLVIAVLVVSVSTMPGLSIKLGPAVWFYVAFAVLLTVLSARKPG